MFQRAATQIVAVMILALPAIAAEPESLEAQLRQRAERFLGISPMLGVAVGVIHGETTYTVFAGHRSLGGPAPDENTVFEVGSLTKTFTTLLLADAVVRNEVRLDQPVADLLGPDCFVPKFGQDEIRLVDLATQTSGLPRMPYLGMIVNPLNPYADFTVADLNKDLKDYNLKRKPGDKFEYSNLGMGLLGNALAKHAGKSYEQLVEERICQPLGMSDTVIRLSPDQQARLARGTMSIGLPTMNWDVPALSGAGAIRSTLHDLLIYLRANMSPDSAVLGQAIALSHQPRFTIRQPSKKDPDKLEIGLAWFTTTAADNTIVWHDGMTGGYAVLLEFAPDKKWGIVVLANQATGEVDELARGLLQDLINGKLTGNETARAKDAVPKEH